MNHLRLRTAVVIAAALGSIAPQALHAQNAEIDPVQLMPSNTAIYVSVDLAAGKQYVDAMKQTKLGQDMSKAWEAYQAKDKQAGAQLQMGQALLGSLQGFGHRIGIGVTMPKGDNPNAMPDVVAVVPILNADQARTEVEMLVKMASTNAKLTWKDETEGDVTIHVAEGKAGVQPLPAYAITPNALVIGSGGALVHTALKTAGSPADSLASTADFKNLAGSVPAGQTMWGYVGSQALMAGMNPRGQQLPFDPKALPGIKDMIAAARGSIYSVSLQPNQIEMRAVSAYAPDSVIGKDVKTFQPAGLQIPDVAYGHALGMFAVTDIPHQVALYNHIFRPFFQTLLSMAGAGGGAQAATMVQSGLDIADDVLNGAGSEAALVVGPMTDVNTPPQAAILIQKGNGNRLQQGIDKILALVKNLSGEKWYPTTILNTPVKVLGAGGTPVRPSYTVAGDYQVLGLDLRSVTTPIYLAKGINKNKALSADPSFQAMWNILGPKVLALFYLDAHSIANLVTAQIPAQAKKDPNAAPLLELASDIRQLGYATYTDPAGMSGRLVLTLDPNAPVAEAAPAATPAAGEAPVFSNTAPVH